LFRELARLGDELVALHLLESPKLDKSMTTYVGPAKPEVVRVGFTLDAAVDAASCRVEALKRPDASSTFTRQDAASTDSKRQDVVSADMKRQDAASTLKRQDAASTLGTVWIDAPAARRSQPARSGTVGFCGVPEDVWNFHIGGYQVCEKWLKDRKGRTLSKEDIAHYQKIVVALNETIRLMGEIDEVIEKHGGWPGAFVTQSTAESTEEVQAAAAADKAGHAPVSSQPPKSKPASKSAEPKQTTAPHNRASDEEKKLIFAALDQASEPLGPPLLSVKTKINRWRLEELLPALVGSGEIKQSGTGGSARYSRTTRQ